MDLCKHRCFVWVSLTAYFWWQIISQESFRTTPYCCRAYLSGTPCHPVSPWQPDISYVNSLQIRGCSQRWSQTAFLFSPLSSVLSAWTWVLAAAPVYHLLPLGLRLLFVLPGLLLSFPSGSWLGPTHGLMFFKQPQIGFECPVWSFMIQLLWLGKKEWKARKSGTLEYNSSIRAGSITPYF